MYMSPNSATVKKLDACSDIYSIGCVMSLRLCGQPPFNDRTPLKIMMKHIAEASRNQ